MELAVDFDRTAAVDFAIVGSPIALAGPGNSWDDGDGFFLNGGCGSGAAPVACTWSDATPYVLSNSWHLGFGFWTGAPFFKSYDPFAGGLYDLRLSVFDYDAASGGPAGPAIASVTIQARVASEPGLPGLVALGLLGAALARRRVA